MSDNNRFKLRLATVILLCAAAVPNSHAQSMAQNPIVQTCYLADPAPMVYKDRVYLYADHDEPDTSYYNMNEWRVYSSADMVNWTDHGAVLPLSTFKWAVEGSAWASQCIERGGKFYWYVCCTPRGQKAPAIGVAVGDSPVGPFHDALGKPLIKENWGYIDPSPWIDDDGQAWLFWGNNGLWYVPLNEDMITLGGEIRSVDSLNNENAFGPMVKKHDWQLGKDVMKTGFEEGPWIMKRQGRYYLLYAAGGVPEHLAYSTAPSINGPWTYRGQVMPLQETGSFTNHTGVVEFKGHNYLFYHTGWLPGGNGFKRSVCVEEFRYGADGSIPQITATRVGVSPVSTLNPFARQQAETISWGKEVKTGQNDERGVFVTGLHDGSSIRVRSVDFGQRGAKSFTAAVACAGSGGSIEVHADSEEGKVIATLPVNSTGGGQQWKELTTAVTAIRGLHDIWFVFHGKGKGNLFNFDYWQFGKR